MQSESKGKLPRIVLSEQAKNNTKKAAKIIRKTLFGICMLILLSGISYVILSPLISIFSGSIMLYTDKANPLIYIIPKHYTLDNFVLAMRFLNYKDSLIYSLGFCAAITLLQTFICSLAGYGFARFHFPLKNLFFAFVILSIVIPAQTFMVPLHIQFKYFDMFGLFKLFGIPTVNLLGSVWPVAILTGVGMGLKSGLFIYIFRQFFRGMPKEIEEAAFIDGAGKLFTYFRIMLPNAIPACITVMLFSFVWQFNDTYFTNLFMGGIKTVLSTNLASISHTISYTLWIENGNVWPDSNLTEVTTNASIVLAILPIIVLYLVLQKYFIEGVERSGIVG